MGRKSSIDERLNDEHKAELNKLIGTGKMTLDGILEWLGEKGYEISRSSLHRYAQQYDEVATKIRQSREMTEAFVAEIGESAVQGRQGRLLVEMARTLAFDLLMNLQSAMDDDGNPISAIDTKDVMMLGKGLAELGKALRLDQDFEEKIRDQVREEERKRALTDAANSAEASLNEAGMDKAQIKFWREEFLGVKPKKGKDDG